MYGSNITNVGPRFMAHIADRLTFVKAYVLRPIKLQLVTIKSVFIFDFLFDVMRISLFVVPRNSSSSPTSSSVTDMWYN